jgi:bacillithiol biosynthesis deacetylase BshB1
VKLDALAIFAHRDDAEITCGGTLIKLADSGYNVGIVDLTQGEMGTRGSARLRGIEAKCAAKLMGMKVRENLKLPDSKVESTRGNKLKLVKLIRKYKPHLVILPYWEQRHPDHSNCSRLGYDACYLSGLAKLKVPGEPHRPYKIIYSTSFRERMEQSFVVDVTEQFERKIEAVKCYRSQFKDMKKRKDVFVPGLDVFDFMRIKAVNYGTMIGVKYGEAFITKELMAVEDPMKLRPRSI